MTSAKNLSVAMQELASLVDTFLETCTGERVAFVLLVNQDNVTQYVSNARREEGENLIKSLLARWEAGRADIPAHYNPDL